MLKRSAVVLATAALSLSMTAAPARAAGGAIEGTVTLPGGTPAAGVCVTALGASEVGGTTAADGTFHLDVPNGAYRVRTADCVDPTRDLVTTWWPQKLDPNESTQVAVDGDTATGVDTILPQGGRIVGTLSGPEGEPVGNGQVVVSPLTGPEFNAILIAQADGTGSYVAHGVPVGSWRVQGLGYPYAPNYRGDTDDWRKTTPTEVTSGGTTTVDLLLHKGATLSGVVTQDGTGHQGLCVDAWGSADDVHLATTAVTAADGSFSMPTVRPGAVRLSAQLCTAGSHKTWYGESSNYDTATPIVLGEGAAVGGLDVALIATPRLRGTVTDPAGKPVAGVEVDVYDGTGNAQTSSFGRTDANGRYEVDGLLDKLYKVGARAPYSRPDLEGRFYVDAATVGEATAVAASTSADGIDITLPAAPETNTLAGTVTSEGAPVHDACVEVPGVTPARSDADGHYVLHGVPDGTYHPLFTDCRLTPRLTPVYYAGTDVAESGTTVAVSGGQTVTGLDQVMTPGAELHGRLVGPAGEAIPNHCLSVGASRPGSRASAYLITAQDGTWSTPATMLPDAEQRIYTQGFCSNDGYVDRTDGTGVTGAVGTDTNAGDLVLARGGSFSGTVVDQFGQGRVDVCVYAVDPTSERSSQAAARTDSDGRYTVKGVAPGTWSAEFGDCGAGFQWTYWHSSNRATADTFTVLADQDRPLVDQQVTAYTLPAEPVDVTVTREGSTATVRWQPPTDTGHTGLTGFLVHTPAGDQQVGSAARSLVLSDTNRSAPLEVSVAAKNIKGIGPTAAVTAPAVPTKVTLLGPNSVVTGGTVTLHGRLTLADGSAAGGRALGIWRRAAGTSAALTHLADVTTSSTGDYSVTTRLSGPTQYVVRPASTIAPNAVLSVRVVPKLVTSASGRRLSVATAPARPGALLVLQRRHASGAWTNDLRVHLDSHGRWAGTLPAGTWRAVLTASGWWSQAVGAVTALR